MTCPRCENAGFIPTHDVPNPLMVRSKEAYPGFNLRRVFCVQCGCYFITKEEFYKEIEVKGVKVMQLMENYQEEIRKSKRNKKHHHNFNNKTLFDESA